MRPDRQSVTLFVCFTASVMFPVKVTVTSCDRVRRLSASRSDRQMDVMSVCLSCLAVRSLELMMLRAEEAAAPQD